MQVVRTAVATARPEVRPIAVVVTGVSGRMGSVMVEGLPGEQGIRVVGGVHRADAHRLPELLDGADVLVDFTSAGAAPELLLAALRAGVRPVSGTSGLPDDALAAVDRAARERGIAAVWAPNFRLGATLMIHFARIAARYMAAAEVVEIHHASKADAPSGTALAVARAIREGHGTDLDDPVVRHQPLAGVRGGALGGVRVHSVRLPTLIGRHEVHLSVPGEVLTLAHDDIERSAFVPNVAMAVRYVMRPGLAGLVRGFDRVMGLVEGET